MGRQRHDTDDESSGSSAESSRSSAERKKRKRHDSDSDASDGATDANRHISERFERANSGSNARKSETASSKARSDSGKDADSEDRGSSESSSEQDRGRKWKKMEKKLRKHLKRKQKAKKARKKEKKEKKGKKAQKRAKRDHEDAASLEASSLAQPPPPPPCEDDPHPPGIERIAEPSQRKDITSGIKTHDWECECGTSNFATRLKCFNRSCGKPRPQGAVEPSKVVVDGAADDSSSGGDEDFEPGSYEASSKWRGKKSGYVFKLGDCGLGYYLETPKTRDSYEWRGWKGGGSGAPGFVPGTFVPCPEFRGRRSGYYFSTGMRGTGYYLEGEINGTNPKDLKEWATWLTDGVMSPVSPTKPHMSMDQWRGKALRGLVPGMTVEPIPEDQKQKKEKIPEMVGNSGKERRGSDWPCWKCGEINFHDRDRCYKCQSLKRLGGGWRG